MANFIVEFPLKTEKYQEDVLDMLLDEEIVELVR